MYKLVISDDEGKTIIVPLVRDLITVGRQEGNTIRLTERNVSRQHSRLVKSDEGYRIEDLDSYNGVTVNGTRIQGSSLLGDGDRVGVGDYLLALKADSEQMAVPGSSTGPITGPASGVPPPARLVMISAPAPGAEFSISKDAVKIGRLEELDLCISHRSISREHARILQSDGKFEIEDLDSANGVRVNGNAAKSGELKSGDLVDLGQVRFRFVGSGEAYTFDADEAQLAEEPLDALPTSGNRKVFVVIAAAVILAVLIALLDDGGDEITNDPSSVAAQPVKPPTPTVEGPPPMPEPPVADPTQPDEAAQVAEQLSAALEGCRTALATEKFDEALRYAQNGLALSPDDDLSACQKEAEARASEAETFERGSKALAAGKFEEAVEAFNSLPEDSALRERPAVRQARARYAKARVAFSRQNLRKNPEEVADMLAEVQQMEGIPAATKRQAAALEKQARRLASAPKKRKPRGSRPGGSTRKPNGDLNESPAKLARGCLARGDQGCAVRALEGRTTNAQELALLIETYRALGDQRKALRNMERFVKRYPQARQTSQYKQFIAKHN